MFNQYKSNQSNQFFKSKIDFFIYIIFDIINIWHYYEKIFWQHNKCKGINSEIHYFKIINMRLLLIILL